MVGTDGEVGGGLSERLIMSGGDHVRGARVGGRHDVWVVEVEVVDILVIIANLVVDVNPGRGGGGGGSSAFAADGGKSSLG